MKKSHICALALILALSMTACGGADSSNSASSGSTSDETSAEVSSMPSDDASAEGTDEQEDTTASAGSSEEPLSGPAPVNWSDEEFKVEESNVTCIFRTPDEVTVTALGISLDASQNTLLLPMNFQNHTDNTISVRIEDATINGYRVGAYLSTKVEPQSELNQDLVLKLDDIAGSGITGPDSISFDLWVKNYDTNDVYIDGEIYRFNPVYGAEINVPERRSSATEVVLYEDENCAMILLEPAMVDGSDIINGCRCYIENKMDIALRLNWDEMAANGYMIDNAFSEFLLPGAKAYCYFSFDADELKDCGIGEVQKLDLLFRAYDANDIHADDYARTYVSVYMPGVSAADVVIPDRKTEGESVVLDTDEVTFVVYDSFADGSDRYGINCYIQNKTDTTIRFALSELDIDGVANDYFHWEQLVTGNAAIYRTIYISSRDLDESIDITNMQVLTPKIRVYDENDYEKDDYVNDKYVIQR
ncbi:MAG: hypothetical protein Q4E57_09020 [Eubacteriales bacterium]|nr:hypothetical protein [Eubacteriales bacterium]